MNQLVTATEAGERTVSDVSEKTGGVGRTVSGLGRRRPRDESESDRSEEEQAEDRVDEEPAPHSPASRRA